MLGECSYKIRIRACSLLKQRNKNQARKHNKYSLTKNPGFGYLPNLGIVAAEARLLKDRVRVSTHTKTGWGNNEAVLGKVVLQLFPVKSPAFPKRSTLTHKISQVITLILKRSLKSCALLLSLLRQISPSSGLWFT